MYNKSQEKRTKFLLASNLSRSASAWNIYNKKQIKAINNKKIECDKTLEDWGREIHRGRRDGGERPKWECLWGLAGRGFWLSPSALPSSRDTTLLRSSLILSLTHFTRTSTVCFSDAGADHYGIKSRDTTSYSSSFDFFRIIEMGQ